MERLKNFFIRRKACKELYALSDHDLKDIGISRGEIPYVVAGLSNTKSE